MSTVAIYNGYGKYEQSNDGEKGITLTHGGVSFWFPFDKVTYIPDFTMREVDHKESSATPDQEASRLTYMTFRLSGERIAEELLETQVPFPNSYRGIIVIANDVKKRKSTYVSVTAGFSEDGKRLTTEVQEIEPTEFEIKDAHARAKAYKEEVIQLYFQGKRERMSGGKGQLLPTGLIKTFMTELGIKDIDDVSKQLENVAATPGITPEMFLSVVREIMGTKSAPPPAGKGEKPKPVESLV